MKLNKTIFYILGIFVFFVSSLNNILYAKEQNLLHVSYDPTRELYQKINKSFIEYWEKSFQNKIRIKQSHGGSSKQARAILDGLEADIVSLAIPYDIDILAKRNFVSSNWRELFPNNSSPYSSTIIFLVRKNNPKQIKDWDDLIREDISVITPNPKTSGGARWNYLAAWAYAYQNYNDEELATKFIRKLYKNVPILDTGARGSSISFIQRDIGDVLISWENEALLALEQFGKDNFEIVIPSISIKIDLPIAIVESIVDKHNTKIAAKAYIEFLFSDHAQEIIATNYYRPVKDSIIKKYENKFFKINAIEASILGDSDELHNKHFGENGLFDQIYENR
ncbi:MAG: sulfate ABC transporter substrate-binding protein [Alphaproteobacteria bacterium]